MIKSFRDLEVYIEAMALSIEINRLIQSFPSSEKFLLVDQMKRASRAICPIIAEGYAKRQSIKTFKKYLKDAVGESNEMMAHLEMAENMGLIKKSGYSKELIEKYDRLGKKLHNLLENWKNY